jgi:hypothetical protein
MVSMDRARRAVAAFTFCSILACSGLGFCWKQFAPRAHDCCEDSGTAPAKSCASAGTQVSAVNLALPIETVLPAGGFATVALEPVAGAFAVVPPLKSPPLVLRI